MKRDTWLTLVVFVMGFACALGLWSLSWMPVDASDWVKDVTGVDLTKTGDSVRWWSEDVGAAGFGVLPTENFDALLKSQPFQRCEKDPSQTHCGDLFEVRDLSADKYPVHTELLTYRGASQWQSWCCYVHPPTRRIWIVVLHPDFSGDPPGGSFEAESRSESLKRVR